MRKYTIAACILLIFLLGIMDHLTGYEISFSIFYLLPILLVLSVRGAAWAVFMAVLSACIWLAADLTSGHRYAHFLIPLWNAVMRFSVFLVVIFFYSGFKKELELERRIARTDSLTDAANSRHFFDQVQREKSRAARFRHPFTLAYIDIDNFKRVNDDFGHDKGDLLLQQVAGTIKESVRIYDIVARLGGDEFAVLFPETNEAQAKSAVQKVWERLQDVSKKNADFIGFSVGAVTFNDPGLPVREMIKEADNLMYSVKKSGKNFVQYKIR